MSSILYAVACVAAPAVWGVLMYYAFNVWDRKRAASPLPQHPPADYSI